MLVAAVSNTDLNGIAGSSASANKARILDCLELNETLLVNDLSVAKANSKLALEMAQQLADSELIAAAKLDWKITNHLLAGLTIDTVFHEVALNPNDTSEPRLSFHRFYMLAVASILQYREDARLGVCIEALLRAANQSGDPDLIARQKCLEVFLRCCYANQYLEEPHRQARQKFFKPMPRDAVWDSKAIEILLNASQGRSSSSVLKAIDAWMKESKVRNALLRVQLTKAKSILLLRTHQYGSSILALEVARQTARTIKSPALDLELDRHLLHLKAEFGEPGELESLQMSIYSNSAFDNLPVGEASDTIKLIDHSVQAVGEPFLASFLIGNDRFPRKIVEGAKQQKKQLAAAYSHLNQERQDNQRQLQTIESQTQTRLQAQQTTVVWLKTYASALTIAMLLLLPWLFVMRQRSRLRSVQNRLMTEQERALESEAKVDGLTARLNRLERMHSLGLMAGGIAHDFNNLLVGIMGNAELIQMMGDRADKEFVELRVASIHESAGKAADIARNMLAYSGKHPIKRDATGINELVAQLECILVSACLPSQTLVLSLSCSEVVISVDRTMAERALLNLVKNASQFSPPGGTITIRTGIATSAELKDDSSCFGESNHQGEFGVIEVVDFGTGISESVREHVFEPFFSTTDEGRGLGLAVVYGFLKSHDGLVQCQSTPKTGTRFRLLLPVLDSAVALQLPNLRRTRPNELSFPMDMPQANGKTVLLIDDDLIVLDMCKELLELTGWKVVVSESGREGLDIIRRANHQIDCVLLDLVMPDMSGREVLNELEAQQISTPVVLTSGFSKLNLESYYARPNVAAIISKPFHNIDVVSALFHAAACDEFSKLSGKQPYQTPVDQAAKKVPPNS
jgi:signal transduction histidine kinase/ActR/RegA family two-component response regulator